ncbi:MFS transporter, DHA1 family, multidrug resistance protein [Duganella sp. CF458]|uniref:multidrug efflux MFS transporter MdtH n=1 Tax=Duganella sp. CF458 TaxID=1884368 RepID=UPI0008E0F5E2|nr:multidrug efflux MFS transporter MdtH [Duganella sp. CF458]SFG89069.1 MFS transporter, DHA1 family, multidrug resistance protein [Duganella sp. CF458]
MTGAQRARRLGKRFLMIDHMLVVGGFYLVFPIVGLHFVGQLGWAAAAVGLALGARQVAQQGLALFGGSLSDRFGAKPMIVGGMLLRASGFALMGFAANPAWLLLSCVMSGLGGSLFEPARGALGVKLTRPAERPRFYSALMMQESVSAMTGALLGTLLLAADFRWVGLGGCAVFVLAALANAWLLPAYRVATPGTSAARAMRIPLRDKPFLMLVLALSGYYIMTVQLMMLVPVTLAGLSGTPRSVAWMYAMDALLALTLLYPMARLGERYLSLEARLLAGIGIMSCAVLAMSAARALVPMFVCIAVFHTGSLVAEPARESLVSRYARPAARASYMGLSRFGLALGGLFGYTAGGWLLDWSRAMRAPQLPWLAMAGIGWLTLALLACAAAPLPGRKLHADRGVGL